MGIIAAIISFLLQWDIWLPIVLILSYLTWRNYNKIEPARTVESDLLMLEIPKANDKQLKVSNAEFINAVDRVSTIASERGRAIKLSINGDKLTLSVNNPEGGSATEEIGVDYDSTPREIAFNAR